MHKLNKLTPQSRFTAHHPKAAWTLLLMIIFIAHPPGALADELITWNVGQGQWVTWETSDTCEHFDIGGEFAPWNLISNHCRSKLNRAHFSHWDWDHVGLAMRAARKLKKFCVVDLPRGPAPSKGKEKILSLPLCTSLSPLSGGSTAESSPRQIFWQDPKPMQELTSNDLSRVFEAGTALIPGDSTKLEEKNWATRIAHKSPAVLILGHHGSRTSTSDFLVKHLSGVRMAIASARQARYGHPHGEVIKRLKKFRIAVLRTEDWGSIRIEIKKARNESGLL